MNKSLGGEEATSSQGPAYQDLRGSLSSFFSFYKLSIKRNCQQQYSNLSLDSEENDLYQLNQPSLTFIF